MRVMRSGPQTPPLNRGFQFERAVHAEHLDALDQRNEDKSVLWAHSVHHHQARVGVQYLMKVTTCHTDALDRQVRERVNISSFKGQFLMNRRTEMGGLRVERTQYRRWGVIG